MIPPETKSLFSDGFQVRGHSRAEMLISGGGKASTGGELFSRSKSVPRPTRYAIPGWTSLPCATWSWPETFLQCKSHPRPAAGSLGLQNLCSQLNKSRWTSLGSSKV